MVYDRFLIQLADMADYDAVTNEARMADVLAAPLTSAQDAGLLRRDLTGSDILMACRMLALHWKLDAQADFKKTFNQRLALLFKGLNEPRADDDA